MGAVAVMDKTGWQRNGGSPATLDWGFLLVTIAHVSAIVLLSNNAKVKHNPTVKVVPSKGQVQSLVLQIKTRFAGCWVPGRDVLWLAQKYNSTPEAAEECLFG